VLRTAVPYQATVFNVLIVSPGDVEAERRVARDVVNEWNATHSRSRKIVLQPVGWETHSHPEMGDRAQEVLNRQILDDADLLVGIFWSRIGTPTGDAPSGSVEELQRHMESGKPTMVYFSDAPGSLAMGADGQYKRLLVWREGWCAPRGLVETFRSADEFKDKFRRQLATKVNDHRYFESGTSNAGYIIDLAEPAPPNLGPEAKTLLLEALQDKKGAIHLFRTAEGPRLICNGKNLIQKSSSPRSIALWEGALKELEQMELVTSEGDRHKRYRLTREGYDMAERLKG